MDKKLKILVTNDDGISSPGIAVLAEVMREFGEVLVVAPDKQQSAVSSALTIHKPLRVEKFYINNVFFGQAVDGSPADCVKLAISEFFDQKPDLVVSGINFGKNTSINVLYSGTIAAAIEGYLLNIPSVAFSITSHSTKSELFAAKKYIRIIIEKLLNYKADRNLLLNVNIPDISIDDIKGIRVTKLSETIWDDFYEKRTDPFGKDYYWFSSIFDSKVQDIQIDEGAIENGYVSISPISIDFNNYSLINSLNQFNQDL